VSNIEPAEKAVEPVGKASGEAMGRFRASRAGHPPHPPIPIISAKPANQGVGGAGRGVLPAATLLPKIDFLAEPIVSARGQWRHEWSNDELQSLAGIYGTSEETVLRRLLTLDLTSRTFYQRKRAEYLARYARLEQQQREEAANDDFMRNRPQEVLSDYGRHFVRLVLTNYSQDRISLADASSFLRVKAPMVEKVERLLAERS
jgi:hypothetical protein